MATSNSPLSISLVERRRGAANHLLSLLRAAGYSPLHFSDLQAAVQQKDAPDLVLWAVPCEKGSTAWLALARQYASDRHVLALVSDLPESLQIELLLAGVAGCVDVAQPWEEQLSAVREVAQGRKSFSAAVLSSAIDALRRSEPKPDLRDPNALSTREIQIARHVALGESNGEIGKTLCLAESTVKTHLRNVFRKLNVTSRVELALFAVVHPEQFGLLEQVQGARVE